MLLGGQEVAFDISESLKFWSWLSSDVDPDISWEKYG